MDVNGHSRSKLQAGLAHGAMAFRFSFLNLILMGWSFAQELVSSFISFSNVLEMDSASKHCTLPRGSKRASGLTPMVQGRGDWPAGVTVGFLLLVYKQHARGFLESAHTSGTTMRRTSRFIRPSEEVRSPGLQCSCARSES